MKKILVFLFLPLLGFVFVCAPFAPPASAAAAAPIVTAGEALQVAEILDFLSDSDLIDLDAAGTYFTPSLYLRMISGMTDACKIPVEDSAPWLKRLFDLNNELFWNDDKSQILQEHNDVLTPVSDVGDLWLMSGNMSDNSLIPYNYSASYSGLEGKVSSVTYSFVPTCLSGGSPYSSPNFYILPLCASGSNLYFGSVNTFYYRDGTKLFYDVINSLNHETIEKGHLVSNDTTQWYGNYYDMGYCPSGGLAYQRSADSDYGVDTSGNSTWRSGGWASSSTSLSWLSPSSGSSSTLSGGDISYLIYTTTPLYVPSDFPTGNYVYSDNPNDITGSVIISPNGEYASLLDFMTNGFKFTGSVDVQGNYDINASVNVSGSLGVTHGGDVTINFNDDLNIWSDDGKSTDFGNGVSLDGNSFNDGFKWLIDGATAVPTVLQQFTFIPPPVLAIITSGIVVMVFLGLWRTFKG